PAEGDPKAAGSVLPARRRLRRARGPVLVGHRADRRRLARAAREGAEAVGLARAAREGAEAVGLARAAFAARALGARVSPDRARARRRAERGGRRAGGVEEDRGEDPRRPRSVAAGRTENGETMESMMRSGLCGRGGEAVPL